jgi:hypothetical protein
LKIVDEGWLVDQLHPHNKSVMVLDCRSDGPAQAYRRISPILEKPLFANAFFVRINMPFAPINNATEPSS